MRFTFHEIYEIYAFWEFINVEMKCNLQNFMKFMKFMRFIKFMNFMIFQNLFTLKNNIFEFSSQPGLTLCAISEPSTELMFTR